jgi:hypothetical protein
MVTDLAASRRKLKDIRDAARRGVHPPELVVAARVELEALDGALKAATPSDRRRIEDLQAGYAALIADLLE